MAEAENVDSGEKVDVEEAVKEILDSRREFTMETPENEILHFFIAAPTGEDIRKADWQYSKIYNQAIVDGFLTQAEMVELLEEKKIISEEYTQNLETTRISLGAELFKLENLMDMATEEERETSALEVARLRDALFRLNQRVNGPMANTCENLAEDARTDFLTSRVVENKEGNKSWADYDAYRHEDNTALAIKSRFEVMLWMQGLESDFLEKTPEQTALRKIAQDRLDRAIEEEMASNEAAAPAEPEEPVEAVESPEQLELPEETKVEEEPKVEEEVSEEKPKRKGRPKGSRNKKKPEPKKDE